MAFVNLFMLILIIVPTLEYPHCGKVKKIYFIFYSILSYSNNVNLFPVIILVLN